MDPLPSAPMPADVEARFEALQQKLVPLWHSIEALNEDEQTIVVVVFASVGTYLVVKGVSGLLS